MIVETGHFALILALAVAMGPALEGVARVGVILSGGNVDLERLPWS